MPWEKGKSASPEKCWKPGQSGNPGGRPKKLIEVVVAAQAHTVEAIKTLAEIMQDRKQPGSARVSAAQTLLDRGWGKAPQELKLDTELVQRVIGAVPLTDDEWESKYGDGAGSDLAPSGGATESVN